MTEGYSIGETIHVRVDMSDHPDLPGKVLDAIADDVSVTLKHRVSHEKRVFTREDHVATAGQDIVADLPPRTLDETGQWAYQATVILDDGRTLVWPRKPAYLDIEESIV